MLTVLDVAAQPSQLGDVDVDSWRGNSTFLIPAPVLDSPFRMTGVR